MLNTHTTLRSARPEDAHHLARLINYAGEGMPLAYWKTLASEGEDPWAVGADRAGRDSGSFSWRNATVAEMNGETAAALITYGIDSVASPDDYAGMPAAFVPLQQLEDEAVGSFYVNVLAAYPAARGLGLGTRLLRSAREAAGNRRMSIIVSAANEGAKRLYEREGFVVRDSRLAPANELIGEHTWLLMLT